MSPANRQARNNSETRNEMQNVREVAAVRARRPNEIVKLDFTSDSERGRVITISIRDCGYAPAGTRLQPLQFSDWLPLISVPMQIKFDYYSAPFARGLRKSFPRTRNSFNLIQEEGRKEGRRGGGEIREDNRAENFLFKKLS